MSKATLRGWCGKRLILMAAGGCLWVPLAIASQNDAGGKKTVAYTEQAIIGFPSPNDALGSSLAELLSTSVMPGELLDEEGISDELGGQFNARLAYIGVQSLVANINSQRKARRLLDTGTPLLINTNSIDPETEKHLAAIFGVSSGSDHMLLSKDEKSKLNVFSFKELDEFGVPVGLLHALNAISKSKKDSAKLSRFAAEDEPVGIPKVTMNLNSVDKTGQVVSIVNLDLIRSATRSTDKKFVVIKATPTVRSTKNGVVIGSAPNNNLWGAYLPHKYSISHELKGASVPGAILVSSAPPSDSRTEFTYSETKTKGFSIGGSLGAEGGGEHDQKWKYVAKTPFNISASFTYSNSKTLTNVFEDYSLLATPALGKVKWEALINPAFKYTLVDRETAGLPILTEKRMTPMMRSASMETYSTWEIPGTYEGAAVLSVRGGYILDRREWWYDRANIKKRYETDTFEALADFVLDFGSPYLTREMTVLIRSANAHGKCLAQQSDQTTLEACNPSNKNHLWGFDSESRYVNRNNGKCLTVDFQTGGLVTSTCTLDNAQQWDWRADRIHSRFDRNWRLYTSSDKLKVVPDASMDFEDIPLNSFNKLNIPWASYPGTPSINDVMPNLNGPSPQISPDWVNKYHEVSSRQRWNIEILRDGI